MGIYPVKESRVEKQKEKDKHFFEVRNFDCACVLECVLQVLTERYQRVRNLAMRIVGSELRSRNVNKKPVKDGENGVTFFWDIQTKPKPESRPEMITTLKAMSILGLRMKKVRQGL